MNKEFTFHLLNDQGKKKAMEIASAYDNTLNIIQSMCPPGRELSIVKTKLEEACFFTKKAMANDPANHSEVNPDLLKS